MFLFLNPDFILRIRWSSYRRSVVLSVLNQSSTGRADHAFLSSGNRFRFLMNGY